MLHLDRFLLSLVRSIVLVIAWGFGIFVGLLFITILFVGDFLGIVSLIAWPVWLTWYIMYKLNVFGDVLELSEYPGYLLRSGFLGKAYRKRWNKQEKGRLIHLAKEFNACLKKRNQATAEGKRFVEQFAKYYWAFSQDWQKCKDLVAEIITQPFLLTEGEAEVFPTRIFLSWKVRDKDYSANAHMRRA
jgi:hypothetical protein